ncbi:MAG: DNA-3-methyladenine glycosylase [Balneolaceae bacterium]|nr:DNA-3-methyladenine glycosylase [Balneolaceae bacterium]
MKLERAFYLRDDVVQISREMLGKVLYTRFDGELTSGIITETEAYRGHDDKACHANDGRRTDRTEVMYRRGGTAYVYLCYGIHHLFNVVTNREETADAVLVRAVRPLEGKERMLRRREREEVEPALTAGPGRLTQALGISVDHYGTDLLGDTIWIEDRGLNTGSAGVASGPRVGVDYAGEHAKRPWRFWLEGNRWVSRG